MCGHGHLPTVKKELKEEAGDVVQEEKHSSQEVCEQDHDSTQEYSEDEGLDTVPDNTYDPQTTQSVFPKAEPMEDSTEKKEMAGDGSDSDTDDCELLQCYEKIASSDEDGEEQYRSEIKIESLWEKAHQCVFAATSAVLTRTQGTPAPAPGPSHAVDSTNDIIEVKDELIQDCPVCDYHDKSQKKCVKHITENHPLYHFKCSICSKDFGSFHTKYRHQKEHAPPTKFCVVCGKGFYFQSELNKHVPVHSEVLPYPCNTCGKRFAQQKSLI